MSVVLDTNQLPQDGNVDSLQFQVVLGVSRERGLAVCIPVLVLEEWTAKLERDARRDWLGARNALRTASTWGNVPDLGGLDFGAAAGQRSAQLLQAIEVIEMPANAWEDALRREVRRVPPTREGRGGRDAAIWIAVLEHARAEDAPTWFVTRNTKDFADPTDSEHLHPELLAELGDPPCLRWVPDNDTLIASLATPAEGGFTVEELAALPQVTQALIGALEDSVLEALEIPVRGDGLGRRYVAGPVTASADEIMEQRTFSVGGTPLALIAARWRVAFETGLLQRLGQPGMVEERSTVTLELPVRMWLRGQGEQLQVEVAGVGRPAVLDVV